MDTLEPLPVTRLARLPCENPGRSRWLIEGLWADSAVGCIGGQPKIGKTWLALDMAFAVATGTPCLGQFAVPKRGHVLLYCAEDKAHDVRARVAGLAAARGVDFASVAIGWIGASELRVDDETTRTRLLRTVSDLKPRLLLLDPLVRLHHSDENSAAEVSALLGFLRSLQRQFDVSIAVVHHIRKSGTADPGTALRGSGDLHAWGDSNLYVVRRDGKSFIIPEHRAHPAPDPIPFTLNSQPPQLRVIQADPDPLEARIIAALSTAPITRAELRDRLGIRNDTLTNALEHLITAGRVWRAQDGLTVPAP